MEPQYPLAEQVYPAAGAGPPPVQVCLIGSVAERGQVVSERVPPDIDHLAGVAWYRNAPAVSPLIGSGDREVGQAAIDERENLVATSGRLNPQSSGRDLVPQPAGIAGEPEEPVLLGDSVRPDAVLRAQARAELRFTVEGLPPDAVQPFVCPPLQAPRP